MPIVENRDGTLWIDVHELSEIDAVRTRLTELGARVTALVPDPTCGVTVEEVDWVELYPKIVPRNGPEPGIIVDPAEIPEGHTPLLTVHDMAGVLPGCAVTMVLSLVRGAAPPCVGKIVSRRHPRPRDPRLRPARPPRARSSDI
jgi:hypothetical protein